MTVSKRMGRYSFNKETMKFENQFETHIHKIISGITFGESIEIPTDIENAADKEKYKKAIYKSLFYNNIEATLTWDKSKKFVIVHCEL